MVRALSLWTAVLDLGVGTDLTTTVTSRSVRAILRLEASRGLWGQGRSTTPLFKTRVLVQNTLKKLNEQGGREWGPDSD